MKKFWLVFRHEYLRHVLRKRFIFGVLSVPIFIGISVGLGLLSAVLGTDRRRVGIVDRSGVRSAPLRTPESDNSVLRKTTFIFYDDPSLAQEALDKRKIQGFYTIDAGYRENGRVDLTAYEALGAQVSSDFSHLLRLNLLKDQPAELQDRLYEGPQVTVRSLSDERSAGPTNFMEIILPIVAGILFLVAVNISGGYLLQAVVEEKENRTIEIIMTSVSTNQFMAGKIAGNLSVGLTQLFIWLVAAGVGVMALVRIQSGPTDLTVGSTFMGMLLLTALPTLVMIAAMMAMIGATTTEAREAQQIAGLFTLPIFIPLWLIQPIIVNPNSPLAIGLSLFPFTSPLTLPIRVAFSRSEERRVG